MKNWLLLLLVCLTVLAPIGCAVPLEEEEEEQGSTESSIVSAAGGACPTDGRMSQGFKKGHDGVDLANAKGTPIFAVAAGVVTASGPAQGYGQWIRIKHDDGSMTEYGHMYRRDVKVGVRVKAGQRIALMGSEGRSTGPHLHLRTYRSANKTGSGNGISPTEYLKARGVSLPCKPSGATLTDDDVAPPGAKDDGADGDDENDGVTVDVWKTTDVRASAETDADVIGKATAKKSYPAVCWTTGDTVSSNGYEHDRWVKIDADGAVGFVSGIFLKGDQTGNITTECP
ncbi:MAG: M23 family metallopeptidase [Labilithrix sp.]|nr:M23 family metallopeptidase [Labilithrix sp.]MCW5814963.1 M23 family metallopeptidase [Labilithrix sp.]